MYKCSLERMSDKIKTFSKFGDAGHGGITRYSLSPEAHMAREEFVRRMEAIGAKIECDDVACMQLLKGPILTQRELLWVPTVTLLKKSVTMTVFWAL